MLSLVIEEASSLDNSLPAPAIAAMSAGTHISTQEIQDLTSTDIDKSLTPDLAQKDIFRPGGYLSTAPSDTWVQTPVNEQGKDTSLDGITQDYLIKMHRSASNFKRLHNKNNALKNQAKPSLSDQRKLQDSLRRSASRYAALSRLSVNRLMNRSAGLDVNLLKNVTKDTRDLSRDMDKQLLKSIDSGDLKLSESQSQKLSSSMDEVDLTLDQLSTRVSDLGINNETNIKPLDGINDSPSPM